MCTLLQRRRRPSLARRELETKTLVGKKKNKEASILSHSALFIYAHQILDNAIALIAEKEEEDKIMTDPQQKKKPSKDQILHPRYLRSSLKTLLRQRIWTTTAAAEEGGVMESP